MTADISSGIINGGLPNSGIPVAVGNIAPTLTNSTIPAGASGPVWQPWVNTHSQAQSALKTQIDKALRQFQLDMAGAQKILDSAEADAQRQVTVLQQAAWQAYTKYMDLATTAYSATMTPAVAAYTNAVNMAHDKATNLLNSVDSVYRKADDAATFSMNLATGSETM